MSQPLISVIIDTYNYGEFIAQAIESVLSQDFPREQYEVLVVDDGSTDGTPEHVSKFGSQVTYLQKSNGGQASALNFGFARAKGRIVALLDADDYWLPAKLSRVAAAFEEHPEAGMVYHRMMNEFTESGERRPGDFYALSGFLPADQPAFESHFLYPTSCLSFRRALLDAVLPIPEGLVVQADAYLVSRAIFVTEILAVPEPLGVYRIHGNNLFQPSSPAAAAERYSRRIATRRVLIDALRQDLCVPPARVTHSQIRGYFKRWELVQEEDIFVLHPPGRLRLFWHLLRRNHYFRSRFTRRHKIVNYLNALGSLVTGYGRMPKLDEWRNSVKKAVRDRVRPARKESLKGTVQ